MYTSCVLIGCRNSNYVRVYQQLHAGTHVIFALFRGGNLHRFQMINRGLRN
jgi:hypothetical protein